MSDGAAVVRLIESTLGTTIAVTVHAQHPAWSKVFFEPLELAVLDVCRDASTRDALAAVLTHLVIRSTNPHVSARDWARLEDGVLTLDHGFADIDDVEERAQRLVRVFERALRRAQV